jgi:hypothetical protein
LYFVQFGCLTGSSYRDKEKLSVSLCVFRAPLQGIQFLNNLAGRLPLQEGIQRSQSSCRLQTNEIAK